MSSENGERTFKLKLKLTAPLVRHATSRQGDGDADVRLVVAPMDTNPDKPLHIGARGGAALKELLATAPNPEEAIREYQATHGLNFATKTVNKRHGEADANGSNKKPRAETVARFAPAEKLLDLLQVSRSTVYESLLDKLLKEMLLRIEELSQDELQRMLEVTFPYIEFRELRKIPIAILARQDDTPEAYLRELTENRRILGELPIHVRRKIMHVDKQELQYFVEQCTQEYITETLDWYLKHPTLAVASTATSTSSSSSSTVSTARKSFSMESQLSFGRSTSNGAASNSNDLWNVTSHMPSPSSRSSTQTATEDRRRQSAALAALSDMIGDSDALYLSTLDILQEYVVTANIPGTVATASAKDYVDYVPFLGALRSDLANLQRDKTTTQMRTDPLHKFIWFLDRAVKHPNAMEVSQLHELLSVIKKLRVGDVPLNKKFKKKSDVQEEEDNFEIVLGPPPVDQLLVVLDKIAKTDVRVIFAEPVPDDVPGYRDIIKEPMDLSTMRKKAKKGKYKTLEMFTDDFNLMIKNCMTFNPDTTVFYKDGKRIGKRGLEIIEKHATTLRGEPQRIRAKKRKKSGPAETMTMLTSAGVVTLKDFGDFDQTGMVPEGICDEALADVALILSDPHVKQMLCDSLLKTLVVCWQKRELPTDNLMCRGLVQLLQVGNPASVRRMLRKKDYVLRAPQVVTMRVVLPLLIRSMATYRIGFSGTGFGAITSKALKEDLVEATLWTNMLRASSTIRSVTKAFVLQSLKDHQVDVAVHLLELLKFVEDEILYRDRVFLHAVGEIGLQDVKTYSSSSDLDTAPMTSNGGGFESLKTSSVWKSVVEGFFISSLRTRTLAAKESNGSIIEYEELDDGDEAEPSKDEATVTKHQAVRSFPLPILHEKAAMVLSSAVLTLEKNGSIVDARVVGTYLRRTLGVTRAACLSLDEFEMLWRSQVFQQCRSFYEPLLSRCPDLSKEIFSAEYCPTSQDEEEEKADVKPKIEPTAGNEGAARNPSMTGGEEEELEAGEVDEEEGAVEDDT